VKHPFGGHDWAHYCTRSCISAKTITRVECSAQGEHCALEALQQASSQGMAPCNAVDSTRHGMCHCRGNSGESIAQILACKPQVTQPNDSIRKLTLINVLVARCEQEFCYSSVNSCSPHDLLGVKQGILDRNTAATVGI
jgi:hypothetical protein